HKKKRFRSGDDPVIAENEAFLLNDHSTRSEYAKAYEAGRDLYYAGQPEFAEVLSVIRGFVERL
ncbi:MAG: nucleotidyl transferase AbiEii/AbiGii toxin family protein, partial [Alphaproteobacteria bacterium]|nr:nucleotidyl transferase AbiEii/AbiGii toxin family protein [Alphaproteobacteria bacterium]